MKVLKASEIIEQLEEALKEYGTYQYYDKGATEILDVKSIANTLARNVPFETAETLKEVAKHEHGKELVHCLLHYFENYQYQEEVYLDWLFEWDEEFFGEIY